MAQDPMACVAGGRKKVQGQMCDRSPSGWGQARVDSQPLLATELSHSWSSWVRAFVDSDAFGPPAFRRWSSPSFTMCKYTSHPGAASSPFPKGKKVRPPVSASEIRTSNFDGRATVIAMFRFLFSRTGGIHLRCNFCAVCGGTQCQREE